MKPYRRTPHDAWGINNFLLYLDDITGMSAPNLKALCKWLDVSEKTLHRWMTGATRVPDTVCYALYHESKWGQSLGFTEAYNDRAVLTAEIARLNQRVLALEADNAALRASTANAPQVAANDALFLPRDTAPAARRTAPPSNFRVSRRVHLHAKSGVLINTINTARKSSASY